jgi:hypothetical protein
MMYLVQSSKNCCLLVFYKRVTSQTCEYDMRDAGQYHINMTGMTCIMRLKNVSVYLVIEVLLQYIHPLTLWNVVSSWTNSVSRGSAANFWLLCVWGIFRISESMIWRQLCSCAGVIGRAQPFMKIFMELSPSLRSCQLCSYSRISPHFMEPEG